MNAIALVTLYYAAIAALMNWALAKQSGLFVVFIAIVASQTIFFGGLYLYDGYWNPWNDIVLITTSGICILVTAIVTIVFRKHRSGDARGPT